MPPSPPSPFHDPPLPDAAPDRLIETLASDLQPVRRLRPPSVRALLWLAAVATAGLVLALVSPHADLSGFLRRMTGERDLCAAALGSALTAATAAVAAFQAAVPGRARAWALLPLPPLLLWLGGSGFGCLRTELGRLAPATVPISMRQSGVECLPFIVGVSLPLSVLLIVMLRRARPLRPGPVAALGGLAAAAAAATLLWLVHPFDSTASDVAMHVLAVGLVVGVNRMAGGRLLAA